MLSWNVSDKTPWFFKPFIIRFCNQTLPYRQHSTCLLYSSRQHRLSDLLGAYFDDSSFYPHSRKANTVVVIQIIAVPYKACSCTRSRKTPSTYIVAVPLTNDLLEFLTTVPPFAAEESSTWQPLVTCWSQRSPASWPPCFSCPKSVLCMGRQTRVGQSSKCVRRRCSPWYAAWLYHCSWLVLVGRRRRFIVRGEERRWVEEGE